MWNSDSRRRSDDGSHDGDSPHNSADHYLSRGRDGVAERVAGGLAASIPDRQPGREDSNPDNRAAMLEQLVEGNQSHNRYRERSAENWPVMVNPGVRMCE